MGLTSIIAGLMPSPSNKTPAAIADQSATGSDTQMYALADHTHKSSVQAAEVTVAGSGKFTWVYKIPFPVGSVPVVTGTAHIANGATQPVTVNVVAGTITNEQAQFQVFAASTITVAVLGVAVSVFANAANGIKVSVVARLPTP